MKWAAMISGWASIVVGFVAAAVWFWSALAPLPPAPGAVLGGTTPSEPFNVAMAHVAWLNAWAAVFTGVSVSLIAVERLFKRIVEGRAAP